MHHVGEKWAYRERARSPGQPVRPVEVVQQGPPRSRKVRIRWLDGEYQGLDEWVPEVRLIVPWARVETFLDDEARYAGLEKVQEEPVDKTIADAIYETRFGAETPEGLSFDGGSERRPILLEIENFEELEPNIPMSRQELFDFPGAFVASHGTLHAGQGAAMEIARRYCQAQPERTASRKKAAD